MNDNLQQAVTLLINKAIAGVESGAIFLEGQLPDYIVQLLMWHGWYNFILFLGGIIIMLFTIINGVKFINYLKKPENEQHLSGDAESFWVGFTIIGTIISTFVCIILINFEWLQIWVAPKVWLVEYAANLVK